MRFVVDAPSEMMDAANAPLPAPCVWGFEMSTLPRALSKPKRVHPCSVLNAQKPPRTEVKNSTVAAELRSQSRAREPSHLSVRGNGTEIRRA